jgi:hypothetical protein
MPKSFKWLLPFRLSNQNFVRMPDLPILLILLVLFSKNLTYTFSWYSNIQISHVHFPLLMSFERIRPSPRSCVTFRNMLVGRC